MVVVSRRHSLPLPLRSLFFLLLAFIRSLRTHSRIKIIRWPFRLHFLAAHSIRTAAQQSGEFAVGCCNSHRLRRRMLSKRSVRLLCFCLLVDLNCLLVLVGPDFNFGCIYIGLLKYLLQRALEVFLITSWPMNTFGLFFYYLNYSKFALYFTHLVRFLVEHIDFAFDAARVANKIKPTQLLCCLAIECIFIYPPATEFLF